jgi:hypothetical protein
MTLPDRSTRISDADRGAAAGRLQAAQGEGRLTAIEYDDRLGRLYQAMTYADLDALFADLPPVLPPGQVLLPQPVPYGTYSQPFPQPYVAAYPPQPYFGPRPSSGLATAGLVFGILGLVGFWIPVGDVLLSGLGVLFSGMGLAQTRGDLVSGRGRAIGGLVCGIIGLIPAVLFLVLLGGVALL